VKETNQTYTKYKTKQNNNYHLEIVIIILMLNNKNINNNSQQSVHNFQIMFQRVLNTFGNSDFYEI
jgi:hypothetical protein